MPSFLKQVSRGADLYFTFRFLRLLTMKWTKTDAYKYKIIDAKGNVLRKSNELESVDEKAAYTMFHRLVYKMRRLLEKIPIIGKTILTNYAAALLLLKEQNNTRIWTDEKYLKQRLMEFLETDWEEDAKLLKEEMDNMDKKGFREFLAEEVEIDEVKNNWAVIDTAPSAVDRKKNEIMAVATDEKDAYDSIKYSEGPRGYQSGAGKSKKTLKVVRIKKKYDIGDVFKEEVEDEAYGGTEKRLKAKKKTDKMGIFHKKDRSSGYVEGIDIEKASMKDVIKDFQSSDAPQFKGKSDKKKKEMAIAAKLSSESVEKTMKPKILSFNEYNLDEMSAGLQLKMAFDDAKIKIKGTKGGKLVIAKKDEKKVEKVIAKQMRKPADAKRVLGSQIVFEDVELDEGKFKKGDIVIPSIGPHKGEKHTIIHDFKNGSYNISLNKKHSRYDQGAAKAKENQLKLVKEEVELDEASLPPQMKSTDQLKFYDKLKTGDTFKVWYQSSAAKGDVWREFKVTGKTPEKMTLQSLDHPSKKTAKFYLYNRGKFVSWGMNDKTFNVTSLKEEVELDEKRKAADDVGMECQECLHKFRHKNPIYGKTKCPKCKSTDLDLAFGEEVETDEKLVPKLKIKPKKVKKMKDLRLYAKSPSKKKSKSPSDHVPAYGISRKGGFGAGKGYGKPGRAPIMMGEKKHTGYELYHKDFSSAMQHAYDHAKKKGYIVDPKEIDDKVATGPKKPSSGKTNRYILGTDKKKNVHIQVANLDNKRYELNMYIEGFELVEAKLGSSDTTDMYALMVKGMKAVPGSPKQKEIIKQINVIRKRLGMKPMNEGFELNEEFSEKDFDALKKGDTITIEFKSPMSSGKATFKVTAKNIVGKARVEKATLKDVKRPGGVKFFLYKRGNKVSLAQGDMAASVVKYTVDEEAPTNSAGGGAIAGLDIGLTHKKKQEDEKKAKALKKMMVGESVKMATFAGKDVFIVDSDMFHNCRMGKKKYHRYEKYVGSKKIGQAIREYGLKFPKRPIILQNGENGPMLYLRYGGK